MRPSAEVGRREGASAVRADRWRRAALVILTLAVTLLVGGDALLDGAASAVRLAIRPGVPPHGSSAASGVALQSPVAVRPELSDSGRVFDGVGAVSGGGNTSRLLQDYPAAQREQVLDSLFRPHYGASLQMLKVEIGADTDSTEGAEPSIERQPGRVDCDRGTSWAIMQAARARNPAITLVGLEWGAPGWLRGGFWSQDNIGYLLSWLGCARTHGLTIDYLGGWNERGYQAGWYTALAAALARYYPHTRLIAADSFDWSLATSLHDDPAFDRAVAVVGMHHPCRPEWRIASCPSTTQARLLHQPLWASEESAQDLTDGAQPLARELVRNYVDGRMTGAFVWSAVSAFYDELPLSGRGLLLAEQPWSGAWTVGLDTWVVAHTTQFASPGWRYLDHASGRLPAGGSYVTLRAPGSGPGPVDWSTVVETTQATQPQVLQVRPGRGLRTGAVHVWCSDLDSGDPARWFVRQPDTAVGPSGADVVVPPDTLCSLTTTTGQHRGDAAGAPPGQLRLPFTAALDGPAGTEPPLFFDVDGAFERAPCGGGRSGTCLAQEVPQRPIPWQPTGAGTPLTLVGDPTWWGDYTVSASVLLQSSPWVELLGRVDSARGGAVGGYALRLSAAGRWQLATESALRPPTAHDTGQGVPVDRVLASGRVPGGPGWHQLALRMTGSQLGVVVDQRVRATVTDRSHTDGQVGLRVGGWSPARFADLAVRPTAASPDFLPPAGETATASSARHVAAYNLDGRPARVLDGRPATLWTSAGPASAARPQWLTLTLPEPRRVAAVAVTPRRDGTVTGMITGWRLEVSRDGRTFVAVGQGSWPLSTAAQVVALPGAPTVRAVRLVATAAVGSEVTVAELRLVAPRR